MLPYPTSQRRLLMMARVFLHEFSEFVAAHEAGLPYPSDINDPSADHALETFLERLAVDAAQVDEAMGGVETAADIQRGLEKLLAELLSHAAPHRNRIHWN